MSAVRDERLVLPGLVHPDQARRRVAFDKAIRVFALQCRLPETLCLSMTLRMLLYAVGTHVCCSKLLASADNFSSSGR